MALGVPLEIEEEKRGDVTVLRPTSEIVSTPEVSDFHDRFGTLLRDGYKKIIVDMRHVRWFGSAIFGTLVASLTTLRNAGGDMRLVNVPKRMDSVFATTQLDRLFTIYDSLETAVLSYEIQPTADSKPSI